MKFWRLTGSTAGVVSGSITAALSGVSGSGYIGQLNGGSLITASGTASRSSGVEGLAIFFDLSATTASAYTSRPFHDLEYRTDFGDETSSTWANGAQPGVLLKNIAYGPECVHEYKTAGTYNPTTQIKFRLADGSFDTTTYSWPSITVTSADTEWATTKTVCVSTSGDFTGAPSGAVQVTSSDPVTAISANIGSGNKRFLFRAGESWNVGSSIAINQPGPSMIGSFGSGAKPLFTGTSGNPLFNLSSEATPTTITDWRFKDISCNGGSSGAIIFFGNGHCNRILIDNVTTANTQGSLTLSGSQLAGYNTVPFTHVIWDEFYLIDNTLGSLYLTNGNAVFANSRRMACLGNSVDTGGLGEHGIRMQLTDRGVFSYNTITGIVTGKHHLTLRGVNWDGSNVVAAGTYSEKNIVSDNKFTGGVNAEIMTIAAQFASANERGRDYIIERNWFEGSASAAYMVKSAFTDVTVRNNVAHIPNNTGGSFVNVKDEDTTGVFFPDRVHVYNNSVYHASTSSNYFAFFFAATNTVDLTGSTFIVRNNILYAPSAGFANMVGNTSAATITQSNNTTSIATSPLFATNPPTALAHFTPGSGSYANGAGYAVPICSDLYGTNIQTTPDMGAVVI